MKVTRRQFIKTTAGAAGALAASGLLKPGRAHAYAVSMPLKKFIDRLPIFGADIPLLTPDQATYPGIDYYEIESLAFNQQLHTNLPAGTKLYGFHQTNMNGPTPQHLGGAILAHKDRPVRIKFKSSLPPSHIIPFDSTIPSPGNGGGRQDRSAVHLHGGLVPWTSDGGPFHWLSNAANPGGLQVGASLIGTEWLPDTANTLTNDYLYPNHQSARFMWYHDHAIGITRTNAYAGIATGYLVTDSVEASLGLPIPGDVLVFQDKVFWDPVVDPNYWQYVAPGATAGDLWYPYLYEKQIWKLSAGFNAKKGAGLPIPSCVAEMFGDTMLVNGVVYPYQDVNGMKRYRLLNACNARFLNLSFAVEDPAAPGEPLLLKGLPVWAPVKVWQIGTEGGFLPNSVLLADAVTIGAAPPTPLLLGPAERADLIVDFSAVPVGTNVILYNDAQAPFPAGNPTFDYFFGVKGVALGFGPNTRTPMMFRRITGTGQTIPVPTTINAPVLPTVPDTANGGLTLAATPGTSVTFNGASYNYLPATVEVTLNEAFDVFGRLQQLIGGVVLQAGGGFGTPYVGAATGEPAKYGTIQIWNIYNLTADAHPMHVHLFNAMILRRRPFRVNQFNGIPVFTALGRGPDPNEVGWKETFKMYPGECTTIAVLVENPFDLPDPGTGVFGTPATRTFTFKVAGNLNPVTSNPLPSSPRLGAAGIPGDEYVWHCHILEHEEHDMMHPLIGQ